MRMRERERIRTALLKQRREIVDEIASHGGAAAPEEAEELRDSEDKASALGQLMVDDRIARDDDNLLAKIDLALERLEKGTYEHCLNCGEKIPLARLQAKPSVSLCLACQKAREG